MAWSPMASDALQTQTAGGVPLLDAVGGILLCADFFNIPISMW